MAQDSLRPAGGLKNTLAAAGVVAALVLGIFAAGRLETAFDLVLHAEQRFAGSFQSSDGNGPAGYGSPAASPVDALSPKGPLPRLANPSRLAPVKPSVVQDASRDNAALQQAPSTGGSPAP